MKSESIADLGFIKLYSEMLGTNKINKAHTNRIKELIKSILNRENQQNNILAEVKKAIQLEINIETKTYKKRRLKRILKIIEDNN